MRWRRASAMDANVCRMRPGIQLFTDDGDYAVRPIHGRRLQRFTIHFGLVRFADVIRVSYCNRSRRPFLKVFPMAYCSSSVLYLAVGEHPYRLLHAFILPSVETEI